MSPVTFRGAAFCAVGIALTLGCEGAIGGGQNGAPASGLATAPAGSALPVDHPSIDAPILSAKTRRLSIEQVRRSLPVALGMDAAGQEITWRVESQGGLDMFADTLGEADYIAINDESLEPSPLYVKFMFDAARNVCTAALEADAQRPDATTRVLLRHVEPNETVKSASAKVDANLRYLKVRFHGLRLADDDVESIDSLRALFDQTVAAAAGGEIPSAPHVAVGWHVVCVALLTAPEFHLY